MAAINDEIVIRELGQASSCISLLVSEVLSFEVIGANGRILRRDPILSMPQYKIYPLLPPSFGLWRMVLEERDIVQRKFRLWYSLYFEQPPTTHLSGIWEDYLRKPANI